MTDNPIDQKIKEFIKLLLEKRIKEIELKTGIEIDKSLVEPYVHFFLELVKSSKFYDSITDKDLIITEKVYRDFINGIILGFGSAYNRDHSENLQLPKNTQQLIDQHLVISNDSFLHQTKFNEYKEKFSKIVFDFTNDRKYNNKTFNQIILISKNIPDEYLLSLSQIVINLISKYSIYLKEQSLVINNETLEQYLKLYDDCFKSFEKYMKISLFYYSNILKDKNKNFMDIIDTPLHNVKHDLMNVIRILNY